MDNNQQDNLNSLELDTIGEILNISMGSAATAISSMLDKQVIISTPDVKQKKFDSMDYVALEPAMLVSIRYVEGISGTNVMVFRQKDMQIILNLLMGNEDPPTEDFEFDELSMSAACEVMNQMMGSSATALSDFLGMSINISTPEAKVVESKDAYHNAIDVKEGDDIVSITFKLDIVGVMESDFASVLPCELAKSIVSRVITQSEEEIDAIQGQSDMSAGGAQAAPEAVENNVPPQAAGIQSGPQPQPVPQPAPQAPPAPPQPAAASPVPPPDESGGERARANVPPYYGGGSTAGAPTGAPPQYPNMPPQMFDPYQMGWYGGYMPPYMYPQQPVMQAPPMPEEKRSATVNVRDTQFPTFAPQVVNNTGNGNMDLLLGVNLDVAVEIGKAKRKIKDIVEFGQGTVIELNKQAGAPVDIMVNGRLLAHGDVVVIDDNFGVRITEIVGTKELMESLKEENF